ncbi:hypothetical protein ACP275_14G121400 [Erythranthe tilingii]
MCLVALRVVNNNPDTFDPEHRPILEFGLDNVQKLKQRAEKLQFQQQAFRNDTEENELCEGTPIEECSFTEEQKRFERRVFHQRKKIKKSKLEEVRNEQKKGSEVTTSKGGKINIVKQEQTNVGAQRKRRILHNEKSEQLKESD